MQLAVITFSNVPTVQSVTTFGICRQAIARASGDQSGIPLSHEWAVRTAETLRQDDCGETAAAWTEAGIETPARHDRRRQPYRGGRTIRTFSSGSSPARCWWRRPGTKIKIVSTDWLDDEMAG